MTKFKHELSYNLERMLLYRYLYDDKKIQFVGPFSAFSFTYELKTAFFMRFNHLFLKHKNTIKGHNETSPKAWPCFDVKEDGAKNVLIKGIS